MLAALCRRPFYPVKTGEFLGAEEQDVPSLPSTTDGA